MTTTLEIAEVFGPTIQGEGPSAGRHCCFVRLATCNLHCAWCDTPYTWDWDHYDREVEAHTVSVPAILDNLEARLPRMVVVSGGEPLLQRGPLGELLAGCARRDWRTEVETNGTIPPGPEFGWPDRFNVSVKLASNHADPLERRVRPRAIAALRDTGRAVWKFVAATVGDLDEIADIAERFDLPGEDIWVMPEARTSEQLTAGLHRLADTTIANGWNLSGRLHLLIWGDARGH